MYYLAVDSGTTHSRIWLMKDQQILKRLRIPVGVRNTAIDGHNQALFAGLGSAIAEIRNSLPPSQAPQVGVAAGMITSNLGICEVKHVPAPAGAEELSPAIAVRSFPEFGQLPLYFIPGIRSGPDRADFDNADQVDIIRGEETEVVGYLSASDKRGPLLYIHLGSHTKFIHVDSSNRISGGLSTLAGELSSAIQKETILRDSLPPDLDAEVDKESLLRGWMAGRRFGMNRALYLVRILHLTSERPKESLVSFLLGVILSEDFRCLDLLRSKHSINEAVISGLPYLQPAWSFFLKTISLPYTMLAAEETERTFLQGAYRILSLHLRL